MCFGRRSPLDEVKLYYPLLTSPHMFHEMINMLKSSTLFNWPTKGPCRRCTMYICVSEKPTLKTQANVRVS
jgi:hypothetical protein